MPQLRPPLPAALLLLALACSSTGPAGPAGPSGGVDVDALFAPATSAEIAAVRAEWAARDPRAEKVREEASFAAPIGATPATARVVSHLVDGNRHYGAVLAPDGDALRPVLVLLHGGDGGVSLKTSDVQLLPFAFGDLADKFVYVLPSFRSEPLEIDGATFRSEGEPSPWDRDVDDALAFLDVVLATTPQADPSRIVVVGFSRGALVGMLMGIRDPRIDRVVEMMGPTDFFGDYVRALVTDAIDGVSHDLPGFAVLDERFIQPLVRGETTMEAVRKELVRRSAVLFAADLPPLQLHHGTADDVVDVSQARSMIRAMEALGRTPPAFESYLYEGGMHDPLGFPGAFDRVKAFLAPLVTTPSAAPGSRTGADRTRRTAGSPPAD